MQLDAIAFKLENVIFPPAEYIVPKMLLNLDIECMCQFSEFY